MIVRGIVPFVPKKGYSKFWWQILQNYSCFWQSDQIKRLILIFWSAFISVVCSFYELSWILISNSTSKCFKWKETGMGLDSSLWAGHPVPLNLFSHHKIGIPAPIKELLRRSDEETDVMVVCKLISIISLLFLLRVFLSCSSHLLFSSILNIFPTPCSHVDINGEIHTMCDSVYLQPLLICSSGFQTLLCIGNTCGTHSACWSLPTPLSFPFPRFWWKRERSGVQM